VPDTSKPGSVVTGRRPSPQVAQLKRTLYFLSRNTLAVVGLAIVLFFVGVAMYAFFYPAPSDALQNYCGTYSSSGANLCSQGYIQVCTYANTGSAPGNSSLCYPVDPNNPSQIAPTIDFMHLSAGPLPFGSLTISSSGSYFYNTFAGLIKGSQWSLGIAGGIVISGAMIGLMLGSIAGYSGGYVDEAIMRVTDIFLAIPGFLLILVVIASVGYTIHTLDGRVGVLMLAFIVTWWPGYTRIVRSQVLVTREQKYVEASKASGAKTGRILGRHIIPNSLYPIFVSMSLDVGSIPLAVGGIAFLGFQIFPTQYFPEWGTISALSVETIGAQLSYIAGCTQNCLFPWWQLFFPGATIFMFAISVNFLSDGLRDALDPRLRR
jgi:peptide/nickel transport system permease protein